MQTVPRYTQTKQQTHSNRTAVAGGPRLALHLNIAGRRVGDHVPRNELRSESLNGYSAADVSFECINYGGEHISHAVFDRDSVVKDVYVGLRANPYSTGTHGVRGSRQTPDTARDAEYVRVPCDLECWLPGPSSTCPPGRATGAGDDTTHQHRHIRYTYRRIVRGRLDRYRTQHVKTQNEHKTNGGGGSRADACKRALRTYIRPCIHRLQ